MRLRSFFAPVALALLVTALAGCSLGPLAGGPAASGGTSPSPTRTDHVSNDDSSSPKASTGDGDLSKPSGSASAADYPCNLYPISVISDLMGMKMQTANPVTAVGEPDQKSCLYDTTQDGGHEFAVEIAMSNGPAHLSTWKLIQGTGGPVSDVIDADDAWGDDSELAAVYGNIFIEAGDQSDASNESATLVHIGLDKLTLMVGGLYASTRK
jgi:predicted small lipoprotein YifL